MRAVAAVSQATNINASTFVYSTSHGNITYALSAMTTGDVYMHLRAPAVYQWVGVGTGSEMDGSVMFILYEGADKNSVTLSPRLSDGHSEPSFSNDIDCALQNGTAYKNSIVQMSNTRYYSVGVHCKNITALGKGDGKLEFTNAKQPFLYAWGPTDESISSASKSASIKRHEAYGNFWMDMTAATSPDLEDIAMPTGAALLSTKNAGADGQAESDGDKVGPAHAAIMLAAYVIIFPLGAILLRYLESVKAHYIVQTIGLLATVIGVGVGIYLSMMYNHSKDISSGHQVFGLVLLALLFAQWAIGFYHHLRFRKYGRTTIFGKVHLYAGPALVVGGIINGFTGFNFSSEPHNNVYYGAAVAVVLVIVLALLGWKKWSNKRAKRDRTLSDEWLYESYAMNEASNHQ
ncbi:hypothetical protein E8E12_010844 [Didymella heteroderae]|uniref:Cytochrome b561 domain-containing protein n=1 Tax=Didymella heteroderae TaxID=1769908 RepID=A0A9P4X0B7_9PLEO|nr:hypothetical protein E8E12_010844 [Didymella heteroderae]